ncbi:MAG: uroporphyrinogen decarboxylase family protein [Chloroflexi bacterium]|nr:uroporphyrinogen decarboxylase family protein [Chloroflexota bacterium]
MGMTQRERIESALSHRQPDRTPIFEYVLLSPLADHFLGHPHAGDPANWPQALSELGWRDAVRQAARDLVELALVLGHDMLYAVPNPTQPALDAAETPAEPEAADPVERLQRRNGHQAAGKAGLPEDCLLIYTDLMAEMRRRGLDLPILAPAYAHGIWTDTELMQAMLLAPGTAHEHFQLATRQALAMAEAYLQLDIDQIGVGGDIAGNDPLISPRLYREFIMPEVRQVVRRIHAAGAWAVTASDGNLWPIIDDWLLGCEVDGYLEIDHHAGMTLGKLKPRFGSRVTFYGNMDPGLTLSFAPPDEVQQATSACLRAGEGSGGHIFCCSNAITASVPLTNYLAMLGAYRDYCGLQGLSGY